jgi:hypothetical protein
MWLRLITFSGRSMKVGREIGIDLALPGGAGSCPNNSRLSIVRPVAANDQMHGGRLAYLSAGGEGWGPGRWAVQCR